MGKQRGLLSLSLVLSALAGVVGSGAAQESGAPTYAEQLLNDLACGSCHDGVQGESDIRGVAPDLSEAGLRLNPAYVLGFLQHPVSVREYVGYSRMPNFGLDERESLALTLFLQEQVPTGSPRPDFSGQDAFVRTRSAYPEVTPRLGEDLFYSLNCGACHTQESVPEWEEKSGPDLSEVAARVNPEWLVSFLREPEVVRPFGYHPGSGSRHPNFMLTEQEARTISEYLLEQPVEVGVAAVPFEAQELHAFSMQKAETLIREKLPCLGCHRLGGEGGRIGPDLSSVGTRLRADYVDRIVRNPQEVVPGTVMPKVEMPDTMVTLIVGYLMQQRLPRDSVSYPSLVDHPPYTQRGLEGTGAMYAKYCASCHGVSGRGDGFNAVDLPTPPTVHADSAYMATRPDDTLFDGIYAGGYILGKSHRMPAWGFTLERGEIWRLVAYMRDLCGCLPPSWSRNPPEG